MITVTIKITDNFSGKEHSFKLQFGNIDGHYMDELKSVCAAQVASLNDTFSKIAISTAEVTERMKLAFNEAGIHCQVPQPELLPVTRYNWEDLLVSICPVEEIVIEPKSKHPRPTNQTAKPQQRSVNNKHLIKHRYKR